MTPMLLYDVHHGFPQTVKFVAWIFYRIAVILGFPSLHPNSPGETWKTFFPFTVDVFRNIIFQENSLIALFLLFLCVGVIGYQIYKSRKEKKMNLVLVIAFVFLIVPIASYIAQKTNSAAYLLMFYPQVAIGIALLTYFLSGKKRYRFIPIIIFAVVCIVNAHSYLMQNKGFQFVIYSQRVSAAKQIIKMADGKPYNIIGKGPGSQYESFTDSYEYFTWYYGHPPSKDKQSIEFYVSEYPDKIKVEKENENIGGCID
jgi:hypothetical protein